MRTISVLSAALLSACSTGSFGEGVVTIEGLEDATGVLTEEWELGAVLYSSLAAPLELWIIDTETGTLYFETEVTNDTLTLGTNAVGCDEFQELLDASAALVSGLPGENDIDDLCDPVDTFMSALEAGDAHSGPRTTLGITAEDLYFTPPQAGTFEAWASLSWRADSSAPWEGWDRGSCTLSATEAPELVTFPIADGSLTLESTESGSFKGQLIDPDRALGELKASFDFVTCSYDGSPIVLVE